jgi:hypothetical protein
MAPESGCGGEDAPPRSPRGQGDRPIERFEPVEEIEDLGLPLKYDAGVWKSGAERAQGRGGHHGITHPVGHADDYFHTIIG